MFSSYGSISFFLPFPVQRKKGKKTALQRRHHPWASGVPARTRPSTKSSRSQGVTNIPINEAGGGRAPEKKTQQQKKLIFHNTLLWHKTYFNAFSARHRIPPVSALCLLAVQECQRAPSSGCQNQSVAKRHKTDITGV